MGRIGWPSGWLRDGILNVAITFLLKLFSSTSTELASRENYHF
jgi:hypothetical protein